MALPPRQTHFLRPRTGARHSYSLCKWLDQSFSKDWGVWGKECGLKPRQLERTMAKDEHTFITIKAIRVQQDLMGEVIKHFEKGFHLLVWNSCQLLKAFLRTTTLTWSTIHSSLAQWNTCSGPVFSMVWEGLGVGKTGQVMFRDMVPTDSKSRTIQESFYI